MAFYDYKCKNEKCANYDRVVTKTSNVDNRDEQLCDECKQKLQRIYSAGGMIKTFGDGVKF